MRINTEMRRWAAIRAVALLGCAASLVVAMTVPHAAAQPDGEDAFIHPDLLAEVQSAGSADEPIQALVVMDGSADLSDAAGDPRAVAAALRDHATATQGRTMSPLVARTGGFRVVNQLWILNAALVELPATRDALDRVAALEGVDRIVPNYEVSVIDPETAEAGTTTVADRTYGIDAIGAHRVWSDFEQDGSGVRVATLDTGVDIDHPDLAGKLVTADPDDPTYPGGWMEFDGEGSPVASEPHDSSDHGTHVAGTIHGDDHSEHHIGVAPGSEMMHGMVIPGGEGTIVQVAAGMQWAIDPTDAEGNPAGEPADVVNMSLGGPNYFAELIEPTQHMRTAGVFPAFAIGNEDPFGNCGPGRPIGSSSPANIYEAVSVGATDHDDNVAGFSCGEVVDTATYWGDAADPSWPDEYVTPVLSAPGFQVLSSLPGGGYGSKSGTSMATPHVAGTVALMLSAAPGTPVDEIEDAMIETSFFDDRHGDERPNTRFGHGRINAYDATEIVAVDSGITGTVSSPDGPIPGATVEAGGRAVATDDDGGYTLRLPPGTYEVTAEAFGYELLTESVTVSDGDFTSLDIELAASWGSVSGAASVAGSDQPVKGATIRVHDTPLSTTTDSDGSYTIDGIPGGSWTVSATVEGFADPDPQTVSVSTDETTAVDFTFAELPADIAIAGDVDAELANFLDANDYPNVPFEWDNDPADFPVIIVNRPGDPGEQEFIDFVEAADANATGLLFLDTWETGGSGIELLQDHIHNPGDRSTGYNDSIERLAYGVTTGHPIVDGHEIGTAIPFDETTDWKDHAWFDEYVGEGVTLIADVLVDDEPIGRGIAVEERDQNRHALLSMHGVSTYVGPTTWEPASTEVFINALDWVWPEPEPVSVEVTPSELGVAVGSTASLMATAAYEDDSEADVTAEADWSSSDEAVVTVETGLVTGKAEGTATVSAEFHGEMASATVTVRAEDEVPVPEPSPTPGPTPTPSPVPTPSPTPSPEPSPEPEPDPDVGSVVRLSGEGRIETALAISAEQFNDGQADAVVLARADQYPDALTGTALAATTNAPLLLTPSNELVDTVADEITRVLGDNNQVHLVGGTTALQPAIEQQLHQLGADVVRHEGPTRFETAAAVAHTLGQVDHVLITTGLDFPDALTAGTAAAAHNGAVLLTPDENPHTVVDNYLDGFEGRTWAIGGPAARAYPQAEPLYGPTRDETAIAVADTFFDQPHTFGIARRDDYPDALAGSAHTAANNAPLLLTYTDAIPDTTATWLTNSHQLTTGYAYGGTTAINNHTLHHIEQHAFE